MSELIFNNQQLENKEQENGEGNIEYKYKLVKITRLKINKLTTQMLYRFIQGNGEAEYYLGIMDDGKVRGLSEGELYTTINCILDCLYKLDAYYTYLMIYNQNENKYCVHIKVKIDKLPNTKIDL